MLHHIIDILKADATVTSYVAADNIFPLVRLQGSQIPAIVVQLTGTEPIDTKDRRVDYDEFTVEITIVFGNPRTAWLSALAVRSALDNFAGNNDVGQIRMLNMASDIFEGTDVFTFTQAYTVHMTERTVSNP